MSTPTRDQRDHPRVEVRRALDECAAGLLRAEEDASHNRFVRWGSKGVWVGLFKALAHPGGPPSQVLIDSTAVMGHRCAAGGKGGAMPSHRPPHPKLSKDTRRAHDQIHALTDRTCRPLAILLTDGQVADCKAGAQLLERAPACRIMLTDKGYDSDAILRQIEVTGAAPNIPPKSNRQWKPCFSLVLYKGRNAIERMFGRLKNFCRIAMRYGRSAANYLAGVCIAATVSY